jgi:hypothetical protein
MSICGWGSHVTRLSPLELQASLLHTPFDRRKFKPTILLRLSRHLMMNPVNISESAIAILQISGSTISSCYAYRCRLKNTAKDASRIIHELNELRTVIDSFFLFWKSNVMRKTHIIPSCENLQKPVDR